MSPRPALSTALDAYIEARRSAEAATRAELRLSETEVRALLRIREQPGIRPSALRDHLGVTSAGVTTLVDRMEVFGDERPIAKEPVNIHDVLDHVRRVSETGFARGIRFVEDYDPSLPPIPASP